MKKPTEFLPSEFALLDLFPKALWADIAWNLAMMFQGDDSQAALARILEEAQIVRPLGAGTWQKRQVEHAEKRQRARLRRVTPIAEEVTRD